MPTYHYQCRDCGHELEEFQSMTEPVLTRCPACGADALARSIGAGAGLIFKGTGFYLTDYRKGGTADGGKSGSGTPAKPKESDVQKSAPEGGTPPAAPPAVKE